MKRILIVLAILLLLLAAGLGVSGLLLEDREPRPGPAPEVMPDESEEVEPPALPPEGSAKEEPRVDSAGSVGNEAAADPAGVEKEPSATGEKPVDPGSAGEKPAVRRNPRDPPPPDPKVRPKGNAPPFGPTGQWEKFPPEILRGKATLTVRVVDREGVPIEGADVHLGPPDIRGQAAVSYAHLRKLGRTDAQGRLRAERLPPGAAAVAGNLTGLLNGRRGLDARSAVAVTLVDGKSVSAEVRLPFATSEFGRVAGVVTGPDGKPLRSVQVFTGFFRAITKRDGRFEIPALPAGEHRLSVTRSGYQPHGEPVAVVAGEETAVEIRLSFREAGSIDLEGTVTGPAGEPVPGAMVYVIAIGRGYSGTVRSAETDEHGRYSMHSLPDRLAQTKVRVQASKMGYHAANEVLEAGLKSGEMDLGLPVRLSRLKLTVLDAASAEPLTRCRFEATKEGESRASRTFSSRSESGLYETWIEAGKYSFLIEAPDHESIRVDVTVPGEGVDFPYSARLVGTMEKSVEISLTVVVTSATTGDPIETATVTILDPTSGEAVSRLESRRPGGRFTMPAPSGRRRIRVSAAGYETWETDADLKPDEPEREIEAKLAPE